MKPGPKNDKLFVKEYQTDKFLHRVGISLFSEVRTEKAAIYLQFMDMMADEEDLEDGTCRFFIFEKELKKSLFSQEFSVANVSLGLSEGCGVDFHPNAMIRYDGREKKIRSVGDICNIMLFPLEESIKVERITTSTTNSMEILTIGTNNSIIKFEVLLRQLKGFLSIKYNSFNNDMERIIKEFSD